MHGLQEFNDADVKPSEHFVHDELEHYKQFYGQDMHLLELNIVPD